METVRAATSRAEAIEIAKNARYLEGLAAQERPAVWGASQGITEIDTKVEHLVEVIQEELVDVSTCRIWQDVWKMLEDAGEV